LSLVGKNGSNSGWGILVKGKADPNLRKGLEEKMDKRSPMRWSPRTMGSQRGVVRQSGGENQKKTRPVLWVLEQKRNQKCWCVASSKGWTGGSQATNLGNKDKIKRGGKG